MKSIPLPTKEYLSQCFRYEPWSGNLFWRHRPVDHFTGDGNRPAEWAAKSWNTRYAGSRALCSVTAQGYFSGSLNGRHVLSHRVIWKLVHGSEPDLIDHKNRDKSNNRIGNLRPADKRLNGRNTGLYRTNTSGVAGVSARAGGFQAAIRDISGKRKTKWFRTLPEAAAWRSEMEKSCGFPTMEIAA
jgi:hypothetical protein